MGVYQRLAEDPSLQSQRHQVGEFFVNNEIILLIHRWEVEEEGEFRIVDSSMVARLWATVKGNKKMNYEKLSRAMR